MRVKCRRLLARGIALSSWTGLLRWRVQRRLLRFVPVPHPGYRVSGRGEHVLLGQLQRRNVRIRRSEFHVHDGRQYVRAERRLLLGPLFEWKVLRPDVVLLSERRDLCASRRLLRGTLHDGEWTARREWNAWGLRRAYWRQSLQRERQHL